MLLGKTIVITGISSGIGARVGELAQALGADIIGVDINEPKRPLDAFIKADIGSAQGVAEIVETLPRRFDALCNVAGVSGMIGAAKTLAINFYGLRELSEAVAPRLREGGAVVNVASIAGYGWRANLERAKAFVARAGLSRSRPLLAAHKVPDAEAYPLSKELLLLWTMRAAHQPLFKDRGVRVNAVSPGPVTTPILKEFRSDLRRSQGRRRHRPRRPRRLGAGHRAACALPLLGRRALDQRRQSAGRRRPRSLDQRECSRILNLGICRRAGSSTREIAMKVDFIIDGAAAPAASGGATFARRDPVTGAVASEAAAASEADVDKRRRSGRAGLSRLVGNRPERAARAAAQGRRFARSAQRTNSTKPMIEEIGATAPWAGFNVHFAASMLREAAALTTQITGEVIPADKPGVLSLAMRQPAGVVLGIAPWNAPVILGVRAIAAPLACGNTVILESSEVCPATHRLIGEIAERRRVSRKASSM